VQFPEFELGFGLDEGARDLTQEVTTMVKELHDAITNMAGLEVEVANAQERCVQNS